MVQSKQNNVEKVSSQFFSLPTLTSMILDTQYLTMRFDTDVSAMSQFHEISVNRYSPNKWEE